MTKFAIFIISIFLTLPLMAQDIRWGVRGGMNLASQRVENMRVYFNDSRSRLGWQAGAVAELSFSDRLTVQPALMLNSKGSRFSSRFTSNTNGLVDYDVRYRPLYLHLPVPLMVSTNIAGLNVFGGIGPYVSVGIGGQVTAQGDVDVIRWNSSNKRSIRWGNSFEDDYRRVDAGFLFTLGVEPRTGLQIAISYEQGLINGAPGIIPNQIIRHRVPTFTTTFFLP